MVNSPPQFTFDSITHDADKVDNNVAPGYRSLAGLEFSNIGLDYVIVTQAEIDPTDLKLKVSTPPYQLWEETPADDVCGNYVTDVMNSTTVRRTSPTLVK